MDLKIIRRLIKVVEASDIEELEIQEEGLQVRITKKKEIPVPQIYQTGSVIPSPPQSVHPPQYETQVHEAKIESFTHHEGREVRSASKIVRIAIEGKSNFLMAAILLIVLVGLVLGVAVMTIRISRR